MPPSPILGGVLTYRHAELFTSAPEMPKAGQLTDYYKVKDRRVDHRDPGVRVRADDY